MCYFCTEDFKKKIEELNKLDEEIINGDIDVDDEDFDSLLENFDLLLSVAVEMLKLIGIDEKTAVTMLKYKHNRMKVLDILQKKGRENK